MNYRTLKVVILSLYILGPGVAMDNERSQEPISPSKFLIVTASNDHELKTQLDAIKKQKNKEAAILVIPSSTNPDEFLDQLTKDYPKTGFELHQTSKEITSQDTQKKYDKLRDIKITGLTIVFGTPLALLGAAGGAAAGVVLAPTTGIMNAIYGNDGIFSRRTSNPTADFAKGFFGSPFIFAGLGTYGSYKVTRNLFEATDSALWGKREKPNS